MPPDIAQKLETAAAQFKEHWESGCSTPAPPHAAPSEETPKIPESALIALLRDVERGDDTAIPALADWMEERGDPRAFAIREVAKLDAVVRESRTRANEVSRWVELMLDGKRFGSSVIVNISPKGSEDSIVQRVQDVRRRQQSDEVWRRLGLTYTESQTLKKYLGINPMGIAATIEEIAKQAGRQIQTIRNGIDLALHHLTLRVLRVPGDPGGVWRVCSERVRSR